jgi:serine/threonine protein kinase
VVGTAEVVNVCPMPAVAFAREGALYSPPRRVPDSKTDSTLMRPVGELVGQLVGSRYRLEALLGSGGVGLVYEAHDIETDARCAIKMLRPDLPRSGEIALRFRREVYAATSLRHPNIVTVLKTIEEDDELYLVMEVLRGESLAGILQRGALGPRRSLVLLRQTLEALAYVHDRGVIHRDVKPANLMVIPFSAPGGKIERVKLLDFGLAKLAHEHRMDDQRLTNTGMAFGTPAYIAPEQAAGGSVDHRADLYAAGCVLVEMATGRPPYRSPDPLTLVRMHVAAPIPTLAALAPSRPWVTCAFEELIAGALAKRPEERHPSATAMIASLDRAFLSLDESWPEPN